MCVHPQNLAFPGVTSPHLNAISNIVNKYSCLILPSISTKVELCKFQICVFLVGFKHACFTLKRTFLLLIAPKKIDIQQTCWFVLKTFSKCTCDCALIKKIENQQCVVSSFNALKHFWFVKLVFSVKIGVIY
ncbi:hypothetical protein AB205_0158840 [Aquarana catesbeiana]|uniref:Uncharacterized protein n=1 Tax=Aquarana catesbeiana TaxID=8400 RepID=A0A2G9SL00_AQUCT|nr:hypothetical protein AB205_0158840 [Aquarana catesbeiana]